MNKDFFTKNRNNLYDLLENKSILIMCAGKAPIKSADEDYVFTPNRNFYYLTGINETRDIYVLIKDNDIQDECLIINEYDEMRSKWVGKTYTKEEATTISGIKNILYLDQDDSAIKNIIKGLDKKYKVYIDNNALTYNYDLKNIVENYLDKKMEIVDVFLFIRKLRMKKQECEIEKIVKANEMTKQGLNLVMRSIKDGMKENQAEAYFDFSIKSHGASDHAFRTIAASGKNACVLHYNENNCKMNGGDLVLFDLGAEFEYYKSDISRTYPVNGKFTERQKEIYNIVLGAQKEVIAAAKPGLTTKDLNNIVIKYYEVELKRIGLISIPSDVSKYYYHGVSHHLGLDTHDVAVVEPLEAGNIITVEPGLYIEEENIGIRIEDDILITEDGNVNLSKEIIKEVKDIEAYMK